MLHCRMPMPAQILIMNRAIPKAHIHPSPKQVLSKSMHDNLSTWIYTLLMSTPIFCKALPATVLYPWYGTVPSRQVPEHCKIESPFPVSNTDSSLKSIWIEVNDLYGKRLHRRKTIDLPQAQFALAFLLLFKTSKSNFRPFATPSHIVCPIHSTLRSKQISDI